MKCKDVLESYGTVPRHVALQSLINLGNTLFEDKWYFSNDISSGVSAIIPNKEYQVKISDRFLTYGCSQKDINCAGFIFTIEHMFHEYKHIQQFTTEWNKVFFEKNIKNVNRMTDIVRRSFVSDFYSSVYTHNYKNDPGEMDAEVYGISQTINYFEQSPIVSQDKVRKILFQFMMSEDYGHKEELNKYAPRTFDDMLASFKNLRDLSIHLIYPITSEPSNLFGDIKSNIDMAHDFLKKPEYRTYRQEMDKCTDGKEQDKLLEQTIVLKYPDISQYVPRLQEELENCKNQMQSRIFLTGHAIPISKINYAGISEEDDFTSSVYRITETEDNKTL